MWLTNLSECFTVLQMYPSLLNRSYSTHFIVVMKLPSSQLFLINSRKVTLLLPAKIKNASQKSSCACPLPRALCVRPPSTSSSSELWSWESPDPKTAIQLPSLAPIPLRQAAAYHSSPIFPCYCCAIRRNLTHRFRWAVQGSPSILAGLILMHYIHCAIYNTNYRLIASTHL